jgi:hypothetical protein
MSEGSLSDMTSRSSEVQSYPNIRHRSTDLGGWLSAKTRHMQRIKKRLFDDFVGDR